MNYQGNMFNNQVNHGSNFKGFQCNQTQNTRGFQGNHTRTVRSCQGNQLGGSLVGHWNGYSHVNQTNLGPGQGENWRVGSCNQRISRNVLSNYRTRIPSLIRKKQVRFRKIEETFNFLRRCLSYCKA